MKAPQVYVIRSGAFAKVGYSRDPESRLRQIRIHAPEPAWLAAVFPGGRDLEFRLHHYLREHHVHDEWFNWCDKLAALIERGLPEFPPYPPGSPFVAERAA